MPIEPKTECAQDVLKSAVTVVVQGFFARIMTVLLVPHALSKLMTAAAMKLLKPAQTLAQKQRLPAKII